MSNEIDRTTKEMKNLFEDPKFARKAWKSVGQAILQSPCVIPMTQYDKDGNETLNSMVEKYSYNQLSKDIKEIGGVDRQPTELEMILHCQVLRARYDTGAAIFVRDTLGAKPVDETKVDANINNPYELMTDDELEMLAKYRENKQDNKEENDGQ